MSRRWLVAGGGTGGHVTMALALGEAIAARGDRPLFVGTARGLESRLIPEAGFELLTLPSRQLMGQSVAARAMALAGLARTTVAANRILARTGPQIVVSVGGYAAVPAVVSAALRRTPVALIEPNAIAGRANRGAGRLARRIYLAFDETATAFPRARARGALRTLGVPLRRGLVETFAGAGPHREPKPPYRLLVFGGSQGARQLNEGLLEAVAHLDPTQLEIAHQSGEADRARVAEGYAKAGVRAEVFAFDPQMPRRYRWADLAVSRAGAITVAELAVAGLPAVLVPYPHAADDHQTANARALERSGAARCMDPRAFDGAALAQLLSQLLAEPAELARMGQRAATLARPEAAREIVADCAALMDGAR